MGQADWFQDLDFTSAACKCPDPSQVLCDPDISLYNLSKGLTSLLFSAKPPPNRKTKVSGTYGTTYHQASAIRFNVLS